MSYARGLFLASLCALAGAVSSLDAQSLPDGLYSEITTPRGKIVCSLEYEKAPMTVSSFVGLAEGTIAANGVKGRHFFDGLTFHRVEPGFVIQGGDPKATAAAGRATSFPTRRVPTSGMTRPALFPWQTPARTRTAASSTSPSLPRRNLDGGYNVFGYVVQGMDVVKAIQKGDTITSVRILRVGVRAEGVPRDPGELHGPRRTGRSPGSGKAALAIICEEVARTSPPRSPASCTRC